MISFDLSTISESRSFKGSAQNISLNFIVKKCSFYNLYYIDIYSEENALIKSSPLSSTISPYFNIYPQLNYLLTGTVAVIE